MDTHRNSARVGRDEDWDELRQIGMEEGRDEAMLLYKQPPDVVQRLEDSSRSSRGLNLSLRGLGARWASHLGRTSSHFRLGASNWHCPIAQGTVTRMLVLGP